MQERKQTVYYVNIIEEGKPAVLRISPNQMQQLNEVLAPVQINEETETVEVCTEEGVNGLFFRLPLGSTKKKQ